MIELKEGERYSIAEDRESKIFIPQTVSQRIFEIIRDESQDEFDPTRAHNIDEDDIWMSVDFIMGEVFDIIKNEKYLIQKKEQNGKED